jgi:hypothetical protein
MSAPSWRFRVKQRAEVHQDLANTEFFAQQDVAERLVREAAQNTLDAAREGESARLSLSLITAAETAWKPYFGALWAHLEAQPELRDALPARGSPIPCLLVEDFGTTGLTGPLEPEDRKAAEQDEKAHRLFWFFKNIGRTSKTGEQLGSFGIGKTVFPYSSKINSFFGYSVRASAGDDDPVVLLGQSQLREHRLGRSGDLDPFGFFAWHEGQATDYLQRAVSETPQLDEFRLQFGLRRTNDEPGLSVVIPYPEAGLSRTDLARAAIKQFFIPILSGQFVIEIHAGESIVLGADTLLEAIDHIDWPQGVAEPLRHQVRLARWALAEGRFKAIDLARPKDERQPQLDARMIDAAARTELSRKFVSGDRIALRVPVPTEPKGGELVWSHVEVYLEYDRKGTTRDDLYVRKGLTLLDHSGQARQPGLRAILVAEDSAVYEMLRSSENVAHTAWRQRGAAKLTQQYIRGQAKVKYVLGIIPGVVQALLSPDDEADWWTLADLFPEPEASPLADQPVAPAAEGARSGPPDDEPPTEEDDVPTTVPELVPKVRAWRAKAIRDGVRIEGNPTYEGELRPMRVTAAYGQLNRRKFRAHEEADFSFRRDAQMFSAEGATVEAVDHNVLRIAPSVRDFSVEIKGFDRRRALDYQVIVESE